MKLINHRRSYTYLREMKKLLRLTVAAVCMNGVGLYAGETPLKKDPLFDLGPIIADPLESTVLDSKTADGITIERVEFTSRVVDEKPERVQGIFAYPSGKKNLPCVFWSMGGMAKANEFFPEIFAKKGYACLAITLPHPIRNSQARFDVNNLPNANFTLLARDQLRGITYLSQRPEVNPDQLAVGGASYGGVFATLLAGVDPRIKAGLSFFGAGNHDMGTNLPQFTKLSSLAEVEVWKQTIDPAIRHKARSVPFMWGVAFNDNWFSFPAVIQTYKDAVNADKRLVIMPRWRHGFPENIDRQLTDFLDTVLTKTRPSYNNPGVPKVVEKEGRAAFCFDWTGENKVKSADLVVSYGEYTQWYGWLHRACFVFSATIQGQTASANLPIPSTKLPILAWANITDENDVVTSTLPVVLEASDLSRFVVDPSLKLNCFIDGDFGKAAIDFYQKLDELAGGIPDAQEKHSGSQSLRVESTKDGKVAPALKFTLFHSVPGLAHHFSVFVKAAEEMNLTVSLMPVRPPNWGSAVVAQLVGKDPRLAPLLPAWKNKPAPILATRKVGSKWQEITLDLPISDEPVDGYTLEIKGDGTNQTTFWVDTLRMEPVWPL